MMKNIYLLLTTACSCLAFSQTTLTKAANDYISGNIINNVNYTGTPDNSVTGYPKTFDNSALTPGSAITATVSTPSASEISTFPGSTVKFSDGGGNEIFYKSSAADLQITGATIGGAVLNFSNDNALFLKFPTSYSNTYTDIASGTGVTGTNNAFFKGTITTTADGAGILKLGSQIYTNVIRVKTFQDYKLYLDAGYTFQLGTLVSTIYTYYDNLNRYPLFTSTTATVVVALAGINQTTNSAMGQANPTLVTQNNFLKNKVQVYPNPAAENIFFTGDFTNFDTVKVISIDGKIITTQSVNAGKIDMSKLPAGNYFLQLLGKNEKDQTIQVIKK